jgi:hypothetical protein
VCRLDVWPEPVKRSLEDWNMAPYITMQGPNEFLYTGNLKAGIAAPNWLNPGAVPDHQRPA